jgi:hypothetical protein
LKGAVASPYPLPYDVKWQRGEERHMVRGGLVIYKMVIKCPKCGNDGGAFYEEYETPPDHSGSSRYDYRKLGHVEGPFTRGVDDSIYCNNDGTKVA